MDRSKVLSGLTVYGLVVLLPTIHLLFADQGWNHPYLERIVVGVVGVLAGNMVLDSIRANRPRPVVQKYWGLTPVPFGAGLFVLYLAWFTNFPHALSGQLAGANIMAIPTNLVPLGGFWARLVTALMTLGGWTLLMRGVRTKRTPQERQIIKHEKKIRRRMAAEAASGQ